MHQHLLPNPSPCPWRRAHRPSQPHRQRQALPMVPPAADSSVGSNPCLAAKKKPPATKPASPMPQKASQARPNARVVARSVNPEKGAGVAVTNAAGDAQATAQTVVNAGSEATKPTPGLEVLKAWVKPAARTRPHAAHAKSVVRVRPGTSFPTAQPLLPPTPPPTPPLRLDKRVQRVRRPEEMSAGMLAEKEAQDVVSVVSVVSEETAQNAASVLSARPALSRATDQHPMPLQSPPSSHLPTPLI